MAFAVAKGARANRRNISPIRPKSAGPTGQSAPIPRPRSPTLKASTPKQSNKASDIVTQIFENLHQTNGDSSKGERRRSAGSKLRNLGTGPSEKILKNQTWNEFFNSTNKVEREKDTLGDEAKLNHPEENDEMIVCRTQEETETNQEPNYERLYRRLVKRIHHLWQELKIPASDRDFYTVAIIKDSFKGTGQIDDLSCYVKRLLNHRKDTIQVIKAIRDRDRAVEKCDALMSIALRSYNIKYSTLCADSAIRSSEEAEAGGQQACSELGAALRRLQAESCRVLQRIRDWREGLWRPQPFMFRGANYLVKMQTDMDFMRSKSAQRVLAGVPGVDLACVLFETQEAFGGSGDDKNCSDGRESSSEHQDEPPAPLSAGLETGRVADPGPGEQGTAGRERAELSLLVRSEGAVQRALRIESAALQARGTFIPSLRFELDNDSDANLLRGDSQ